MRPSGRYARRDSGHYGANAVQPAFGGSPPDCPGCAAGGFPFIHIPNGMRLKGKGLSHGLKKSPPDSFLRQLRCRRPFESHPMYQKRGHPKGMTSFFGTPEGTRTPDLLIRSQSLYPTELLAHTFAERLDIVAQGDRIVKQFFAGIGKIIFVCAEASRQPRRSGAGRRPEWRGGCLCRGLSGPGVRAG